MFERTQHSTMTPKLIRLFWTKMCHEMRKKQNDQAAH